MSDPAPASATPATKKMDDIVALCRRRGFIFQSSEIYGGINGFWDYGPMGVELKRNLKEAWWQDIVKCPPVGPNRSVIDMVGVDCTIIMNPKVWVASGHAAGFNDPMVDDKETKQRFRADHLMGVFRGQSFTSAEEAIAARRAMADPRSLPVATVISSNGSEAASLLVEDRKLQKVLGIREISVLSIDSVENTALVSVTLRDTFEAEVRPLDRGMLDEMPERIPSPYTGKTGALTSPRQFNLMFITYVGAVQDEDSKAFLRPETAQGIFCNFRNVVDTSRVKVPFGIAQVGKAFRNEVTPRNFTFRSREFEQMEIEFFIHPDSAKEWYAYWRDARFAWWKSIGLAGENLQLREHDKDELAHYAKEGAGTSDIEYRFPFTSPGFGELEGVAHRTDFDLRQHAQHSGLGDKLMYFDQDLQVKLQNEGVAKDEIARRCKYFPHVIEPSAGADRGTLALICEAYTPDESRPSKVYMAFHPRMAPIKAGVFPLVNKDGMPEIGEKLYMELRKKYSIEFDVKQSIGKRYARMDEVGTPFCFTIDGETLSGGGGTVTVRHRDTQQQERIALDQVGAFLAEKIR